MCGVPGSSGGPAVRSGIALASASRSAPSGGVAQVAPVPVPRRAQGAPSRPARARASPPAHR